MVKEGKKEGKKAAIVLLRDAVLGVEEEESFIALQVAVHH